MCILYRYAVKNVIPSELATQRHFCRPQACASCCVRSLLSGVRQSTITKWTVLAGLGEERLSIKNVLEKECYTVMM